MKNKIGQKIFLLLFSLGLTFFVLEIIVRAIDKSPHQDIYTRDPNTSLLILKPEQEFVVKQECFENKIISNSFGFNSREYDIKKPDDVFRIVIVGDSFVESNQIPLANTFFTKLEEKLNSQEDKQYKYEIIPFGISSHGTYLNLIYLKEYAMQYQPDLIIDAFLVANDVTDDFVKLNPSDQFDQNGNIILSLPELPETNFKTKIKSTIKNIFKKSALIMFSYEKYLAQQSSSIIAEDDVELDKQVFLSEYSQEWQQAWDNQEKFLAEFQNIAIANNIDFLLLSLTEAYRVHDNLFDELDEKYKNQEIFDYNKPETILQEIADEHKFSYLALYPAFKKRAQNTTESTVWSCDGHWNELGHDWASDIIYGYLTDNIHLINR